MNTASIAFADATIERTTGRMESVIPVPNIVKAVSAPRIDTNKLLKFISD